MNKFLQMFQKQIPDDIGEVHIEWDFPEFIKERKSKLWYLGVAIILVLLLLYSIMTVNYLFVIILFLSVFIIVYQFFQEPRQVNVKIAQDGIIIDNDFYPYKLLKNFWIIYQPPEVKNLYVGFKNNIRKSYSIPLHDINPIKVRDLLLQYLKEDTEKEEEETDDILARAMKLR